MPLVDAIEGARRYWHEVHVAPDDIAAAALVIEMARRLIVVNPIEQPGLFSDRRNDLDVALWELDHATR